MSSKEHMARVPNRASRRIFLKSGLGVCAAGALIHPISGEASTVRYYKAVFDGRFEESRAFAAGAAARGIATAAVRGDVTRLFFDDLDLRWKQGPVWLAGYTTAASLFCLELLARDRGMRLRYRLTNADVGAALRVLDGTLPRRALATDLRSRDGSNLVLWILAPRERGLNDPGIAGA